MVSAVETPELDAALAQVQHLPVTDIHVQDFPLDNVAEDLNRARGYNTSAKLGFHTDNTDVVGLLRLCASKHGGLSRITGTTSIYNESLLRRPELLEPLFEGFYYDLKTLKPSEGLLRSILNGQQNRYRPSRWRYRRKKLTVWKQWRNGACRKNCCSTCRT